MQLPEPTSSKSGYATIADITKERIRRAGAKVRADNPLFKGDTGFRVFKLASSNIRAWDPDRADLQQSLLDHTEHLVPGRTEQDLLFEALLRLGLDLSERIETRTIHGHTVHSVGAGALMLCFADGLTRDSVEPFAQGLLAWHAQLAPAVATQFVFKDSGFVDDVAKTNLVSILEQNLDDAQRGPIRSL